MLPPLPPENFSFTIFSQKSLGFYFFAIFAFTYVISYFILKRKKENRQLQIFVNEKRREVRRQMADLCRLFVSTSHRNILESSSSVIFPIQLSPTETVMSARDLFFWMISLIFSSKVFLVMKRWTRTLFFWPMR